MSAASRLKFLYLAYASKPTAERFLYRAVRRRGVSRIVEFGVMSPSRSRRLIEVAQRYATHGAVRYTGIDLFEGAARQVNPPGLEVNSLIEVYRTLKPTGAAVRLIPGRLAAVIPDAANTLPRSDLLLIGPSVTDDDLGPAWFYLPRMLHGGSLVLRQRASCVEAGALVPISLSQIQTLALQRPRAAA